jgi:hypothetical protein
MKRQIAASIFHAKLRHKPEITCGRVVATKIRHMRRGSLERHIPQKTILCYLPDRRSQGFRLLYGMQTGLPVRIVNVERLTEGVIVEFDDGTGYVYPTDLVLCMPPYAREIGDLDTDEKNVDLRAC